MAAAVDLPYLSSYLSVAETTLSTAIDEPTTELVGSILQAVLIKAREHDEIKADKLRLDVELENAVRTADAKIRSCKATLDRASVGAEELRDKLKQQEHARSALEAEVQSLKETATSSQSELQTLRSRVSSLESSNRDTLSLLEAKSTAHDRLAEELASHHQKTVELRRQISELEQSVQASSSASTTAKFRESNLHQELELLKRNNEWLEGELKTKTAENSKSRKEKNAKIAELQRQNEEARSTIDSLKRTEATLRTRLSEVEQKADQSFIKIQQLQEDAARNQEAFRKELEGAQRLAELFEASAKTAKDRLQDVQASFEQAKDEAAEDIDQARTELNAERAEKEAAEHRVMELEVQVERLEADLANVPNLAPLSGTSPRRLNGSLTPNRDSPGASRIKGNLNFTQMYTEYTNAKAQLEIEKRHNAKLSTTIDEMIQDLESKQPEFEELRTEHERLETEMVEMTSLLEAVSQERDKARKEARKWEGEVQGLQREGGLLRQQLRDLSAQVKVLLTEMRARDEGLDALDPAQQMELERLARGELDENALDDMTDTGRLISERLTIFHDIQQLQEQNTNLLRLTRELGDRMEGEEAMRQQSQQARDLEELQELRRKVEMYEDDLKAMITRSESYLKERDMFRRMLQHRGQLPANSDLASIFGQSIGDGAPEGSTSQGVEPSANARDVADLSKLLKEMQAHFDSYREEAATDHRALKEQSERLSREKSELQAEVARSNSQVSLARERLEMLQSNFNMLKTENSELQKRSNSLAEIAAKQDLRTQQVAEDLVESKGLVDSMQKEIANLKAEKDLWRRIESRLTEDNEGLVSERNRLSGLITSLQTLQNERELSESESRRKLQTQIETYAAELQSVKRKYEQEIEESKRAALRKELEAQQYQKKIDDLRTSLATAKEELVAAQTSRDHLQARVDELTAELRGAEERMHMLQPQPSATANGASLQGSGTTRTEAEDEQASDSEQELSAEVAELKRDLELARSDLRHAKDQVEQYRAISQSSEEELQSLSETYEQYREEVDRLIAEKDAKIRNMEHALEELGTELSNSTSQLSSLNAAQAERAKRVDEEKHILEDEIARLKDQEERYANTAKSHQDDLKAQAEIAKQAQQNYESELLKHAEAAKALQELRKEHNLLRTQVAQLKTDAEAAKVALSQNESSWEETKQRYDSELKEMRLRRDDVNNQNNLLHKQLEAISSEITALRQRRSTISDEADESSTLEPASDRSISGLREVITFLRRDKEIVDVQYELSIQEAKRLKQQLDYTQSQLDECRLKLDQERHNNAEGDRSSMTHKELLEKINELNLYRESTVTLRNEAREAQAQLAEKTKKVEELIAEIQPLRATIQELESEKETCEGEMKLLQDDRDRWQQRTQSILQKYDRVDPAEMEALKEEISTLKTEQAQLLEEKEQWQSLKEQVDSIPQQIQKAQEEAVAPWRERQEKQIAQFKERSRTLVAAKNEKVAEYQKLAAEKEELEKQVSALEDEVQVIKTERDTALANFESISARQAQVSELTGHGPAHDSQPVDPIQTISNEERESMEERVAVAERAAREQENRAERLQAELTSYQARIAELEQQTADLQQRLDEANARVAQLESLQLQRPDQEESGRHEEIEKLHEDLRKAQQEINDLRTDAAVTASIRGASTDDDSKTIAEQVSEQVGAIRHDLDLRHAERVQLAEFQFQQRADRMKTQLTKRLTDGKDQIRQSLEAEHNEALNALKNEHQEEIKNLKARHEEELHQLKTEGALRLTEEKQKWLASNPPTSSQPQDSVSNGQTLPEGSVSEWKISEVQLRELARTNPIMQGILRSNISTQTKKVREEQERLMEEKLREAVAKAEKEKEQAVAMEAQRQKVKLSMAEGKARVLAAKTEVVQKAATETPQQPVSEVWELAKVAKPAPTLNPQPSGHQAQGSPASTSVIPPAPGSVTPTVARNISQAGPTSQPSLPPASNDSPVAQQMQQLSSQMSFIDHALQSLASQPAASSVTVGMEQQAHTNPSRENQSVPSKLPQGHFAANTGTGPGALRTILGQGQSMLPRLPTGAGRAGRGGITPPTAQLPVPVPQNTAQRQNQHQQNQGSERSRARGRGRGQGRGNHSNLPIDPIAAELFAQAQNQQILGNSNAALNASARQFVPGGGKRQREEGPGDMGSGGNRGSGGKRPRGGNAG